MGDMKILLKMILQRKIYERRAGSRKFHAGSEAALHQRNITGREMAIERSMPGCCPTVVCRSPGEIRVAMPG